MPAFLYFFPGEGAGLTAAEIRATGLPYFPDGPLSKRGVTAGPGGRPGLIVAAAAAVPDADVGYFPDRQVWRPVATFSSGRHGREEGPSPFVGLYPNAPPGPEDLARPASIDGHCVELLDGRQWLVPAARQYSEEDGELRYRENFPRAAELDEAGNWARGQVVARYRELWDLAQRFDEALRQAHVGAAPGQTALRFDFADVLDGAVLALGANYAIGRTEAALLGLLTEELAIEVLKALIDWPTRLAWSKKKLASESATPGS